MSWIPVGHKCLPPDSGVPVVLGEVWRCDLCGRRWRVSGVSWWGDVVTDIYYGRDGG